MAKPSAVELTEPTRWVASHISSGRRMKRRIIVLIALAAATAACSDAQPGAKGRAKAQPTSDWVQPPHVDAVLRDGAVLVVRGSAAPDARVVLRAGDGDAIAATADSNGRFELRLPALQGDVFLRPEVQVGEDAAASPETLVVVQAGAGPIALIASGRPTIRLDVQGILSAVDYDGRTLAASGRTGEGAPAVLIDGQKAQAAPMGTGGWIAFSPDRSPRQIDVGGRNFTLPDLSAGAAPSVERAGDGWRITTTVAPQGRQTTWLPDIGS